MTTAARPQSVPHGSHGVKAVDVGLEVLDVGLTVQEALRLLDKMSPRAFLLPFQT